MMSQTEPAGAARIRLIDRLQAKVSDAARVRLGLALLEQGRDQDGFRQFALAARKGMAEAQYHVGRCYLAERGAPQNHEQAAHWLELAARQGHRAAQTQLAMLLLDGFERKEAGLFAVSANEPDVRKALSWALAAAEAGEPEAQALVGHILTTGPDTVQDPAEAELWYRRSAEAGCPRGSLGYGLARLRVAADESERSEAARSIAAAAEAGIPTAVYLLATLTAGGHGVAQDPDAAAILYKQAAEMGVVAAQTRWGVALLEGRGTARNVSMAEFWLRRAALAHDAEAATRLGTLYTQGGEVPPNFTEAVTWLEQGAAHGKAEAARMLGQLYLSGAGVERNAERAADWLQKAMFSGDAQAETDLGNLVLSGEVENFDRSVLSQRFKVAAEAGDRFAAFNYGVCLAQGFGVAPDWRTSIDWLRKSADVVPDAEFWIDNLLAKGRDGEQESNGSDAIINEAMNLSCDISVPSEKRSECLH